MKSWGAVNEAAPQVEAGFMEGSAIPVKTIRAAQEPEKSKQALLSHRKANGLYSIRAAQRERHDV